MPRSGRPPAKPRFEAPIKDDLPDPAVTAAVRFARERELVALAEVAEEDAEMYWNTDDEVAQNYALTRANNLRLQAVCLRERIGQLPPAPPPPAD